MTERDMVHGKSGQTGHTYLLLLFAVALTGYSLVLLGETWRASAQRELREESEFVLAAYAQALASFRLATPDGSSYRPQRLEELLEESRSGVRRRHLRRLYADPSSGKVDWNIVRDALGIVAVCPRLEPMSCANEALPPAKP